MENKKKFWLCNGYNVLCTALSSIKPPVIDDNCFSNGWNEISKEVYDSVVKQNSKKTCKWTRGWDIETDCNNFDSFSEMQLIDFKYCPYCGGKIEIER